MTGLHRFLVVVMVVAGVFASLPPRVMAAEELVADISSRQIAITSRFAGTSLLLFGAVDWFKTRLSQGNNPTDVRAYDIVIVVRGPKLTHLVRKKDQVAGVWVNTQTARIDDLPGYYGLSATRPLDEIFLPGEAEKYGLGFDQIPFSWQGAAPSDPAAFREAIMRNKGRDGLYNERFGRLEILGETLFRTEFYFPASVPVGRYHAEVYLVRNGMVVTRYTTPLSVDRIGIEGFIYDFAQLQPALYGLFAIIVAVFAGLVAGAVSRRLSR